MDNKTLLLGLFLLSVCISWILATQTDVNGEMKDEGVDKAVVSASLSREKRACRPSVRRVCIGYGYRNERYCKRRRWWKCREWGYRNAFKCLRYTFVWGVNCRF